MAIFPNCPDCAASSWLLNRKVLEVEQAPVLDSIDQARKRVLDALAGKEYEDQKRNRYFEQFREIRDSAERCNNVSALRSFGDKADALKLRLLSEMDSLDAQIAQKKAEEAEKQMREQVKKDGSEALSSVAEPAVVFKVRKTKRVSIKQMTGTASWRLESVEDVDKYLAELRKRLTAQLDAGTILNVEF